MARKISTREELKQFLVEILGSNNVYFQPPPNVTLGVPCFVYNLSDINSLDANNERYRIYHTYSITLMTTNPDPPQIAILEHHPKISFKNRYPSGGTYYFIFSITV